MIEAQGNVASDFNVLPLIVTNRYFGCVVEQDVSCLQGGVGKESCRYKIGFSLC
jgi:hypothetical protein